MAACWYVCDFTELYNIDLPIFGISPCSVFWRLPGTIQHLKSVESLCSLHTRDVQALQQTANKNASSHCNASMQHNERSRERVKPAAPQSRLHFSRSCKAHLASLVRSVFDVQSYQQPLLVSNLQWFACILRSTHKRAATSVPLNVALQKHTPMQVQPSPGKASCSSGRGELHVPHTQVRDPHSPQALGSESDSNSYQLQQLTAVDTALHVFVSRAACQSCMSELHVICM